MQQKKTSVKPAAAYITTIDDPLDIVREKIEALPTSFRALFSNLGRFLTHMNAEFVDFNNKLEELRLAIDQIKWMRDFNKMSETDRAEIRNLKKIKKTAAAIADEKK